jgi:hypothetical protein
LPELTQTPSLSAYHSCQASVENAFLPSATAITCGSAAVLLGEGEIALVVRRHGHHRAVAVAHQHVVADPHFDLSPVSGWVTKMPVGMPFFSIVAMSASATPPRLHSSMKARVRDCSSPRRWPADARRRRRHKVDAHDRVGAGGEHPAAFGPGLPSSS